MLVLGLKEGLVECATVCVKSEVILTRVACRILIAVDLDSWPLKGPIIAARLALKKKNKFSPFTLNKFFHYTFVAFED